MAKEGLRFTDFYAACPVCSPTRASILTGRYPQNTHVLTNEPPAGGFLAWTYYGNAPRSFAVGLSAAGYRTRPSSAGDDAATELSERDERVSLPRWSDRAASSQRLGA